jgi:hypothetical protein
MITKFSYPQVGQFVLTCFDKPHGWLFMERENLPMETIGIITLVKKDFVYYTDYLGKFVSFQWRFVQEDSLEYKPNRLYCWKDTNQTSLLEYNLARKYRQTPEALKRDIENVN